MKVLVTAGNTMTPVDRVRCITNIFTGKTGAQIALEGVKRGHRTTLLTSHPKVAHEIAPELAAGLEIVNYETFDDLHERLAALILGDGFDVLIHAAAVSDFRVAGVLAPGAEARFDPATRTWAGSAQLDDVQAGKVKSGHRELWLRLVPTPKLADMVRPLWSFRGAFVKFKLEVGIPDRDLLAIAAGSRERSDADLIVANTLEDKDRIAFIGDRQGIFEKIERNDLAAALWDRLETLPH